MDEENLPLPKRDYMKLISLCAKFGPFKFNGKEYEQHNVLPVSSMLSPVMACLFMETLENDKFLRIIGRDATWIRYIDDILAVIPKKTTW